MITGITAKLTFGNDKKKVGYVTNWTVESSREMLEINTLGSVDKEILPSLSDWSASAEGVLAFSESDANQSALISELSAGNEIAFEFVLETISDGGVEQIKSGFRSKALIESVTIDASAGELPGISISIVGTAPLEFVEYPTAAN